MKLDAGIVLQLLPTAIAAGVAYYVYRTFFNRTEGSGRAIDEAVNLVTTRPVKILSQVIFPSGKIVSMEAIIASGGGTEFANGALYLTYQGRSYELTGRDANGNYIAVPL